VGKQGDDPTTAMGPPRYLTAERPLRERLLHQARILGVLSRSEFKFKYAGSLLGYAWSVMKPLMYFAILWVIFGRLFRSQIQKFPLYLILGVVLWTFVADAVTATLPSIVARGPTLRRIWFPPIVIPVSATVTALMTLGVNLLVVVVFIAASDVSPNLQWALLIPLLVELYLFALGLSMIASTLYVRYRDISQIWEVATSLLFFTAPIMYPVSILPIWARHIIVFNPFVQILQDARRIVLGPDSQTVRLIGHHGNHLIPGAVIVVLLVCSAWLYRTQAPKFAELA